MPLHRIPISVCGIGYFCARWLLFEKMVSKYNGRALHERIIRLCLFVKRGFICVLNKIMREFARAASAPRYQFVVSGIFVLAD